jgi:hypothetical protein
VIPKASIKRYYRIDRREIHYLKFIFEGYSGVAVMRTVDPRKSLMVLHIGPGCEGEVDMIMNDLQGHIRVEVAEIPREETL